MSLKYRLFMQSIIILIITIIITGCAAFCYTYFYDFLNKSPNADSLGDSAVIVLKNDSIIYQSNNFSSYQVKEIQMNISVNNTKFIYGNVKYNIKADSFSHQDNYYKVLKLDPVLDLGGYYKSLILFVIVIFIVTFMIATIIVQNNNMKKIIKPVIDLKKETEKLREGELDTAVTEQGYSEVRELGKAIEQLRIKLKNSIFYQQKAEENRKFLISSISHDLKTPVTSIRGYIEGVLEGVANNEEKKKDYLNKAIEKTKLINTMTEDLLLYSKLDLNQIIFDTEKTNILNYIEYCVSDNLYQFEIENKDIAIENGLAHSVYVKIDRKKFKRVIQNIIDNAKKNIEEQTGTLIIKLRNTNNAVILEFLDNGRGINQKDLPYIFDRFYRADFARTIEGSSGLGLAIAKQIVEGLDGRIWAVSKADSGASILISLKIVR